MKINRNFYVVSFIIAVIALAAFAIAGIFGNSGNDAKNGDKVKACPECVCSENKCPEKNLTCPECICPQQKCPDVKCPEFECPKPAGNVTITTEVKNYGAASFNEGKIKFTAGSKNQASGVNSTFTWNTSQNDRADIILDLNYSCPACQKCDSGSCSCSCSACPSCSKPEKPDLTIANITIIGNLTAGENIEIVALVKNLGDAPIDYTKVEIRIDNFTDYRFVHLNANSEKNVSFNWTVVEGEHALIAIIDPENFTIESDKTNNNLTIKGSDICFVPYDDMYINKDTKLCYGNYNIRDSGASGVIIINASNIVLDCNGAVLNGPGWCVAGIRLLEYDNVTIKNCNIINYTVGIRIYGSERSSIFSNNISKSLFEGIYMEGSSNTIYNNNISLSADGDGIRCLDGFFHNISNNEIWGNNGAGISLYNLDNSIIAHNKIHSNVYGIYLINPGIYLSGPGFDGILPPYCDTEPYYCPESNVINDNIIANNDEGIVLHRGRNNTINRNIICNNTSFDFYLPPNGSFGDYGTNNTCNKPSLWDDLDNNIVGCKYSC